MERPRSFDLPDLSGLDTNLIASYVLSLSIGRALPPGRAQFFVAALIWATEGSLRRYNDARSLLEGSAQRDSLVDYLRGAGDMELLLMSLNRGMRIATALCESSETVIPRERIPSQADRNLLTDMRNAVEHNNKPILRGLAGTGRTLALYVRATDTLIEDEGNVYVATHRQLAEWITRLHALSGELTNHPERWARNRPVWCPP